jgi:hypothetical protein
MKKSAQILFQLIDQELEYSAEKIKDIVFSKYKDLPWAPEHRAILQPAVRDELERLIQGVFGVFDNVGGILPDEAPLYTIIAVAGENVEDVSDGIVDYSSLWLDYLMDKQLD